MTLCIDLGSYNMVQAMRPMYEHLITEYMDIVFANEEECAAYTQTDDPHEGLRRIAEQCRLAVVKLGGKGAIAMWGASSPQYGQKAEAPALKVDVRDTTAAGDFFAGGFLYALCAGAPLERCLQTGALLSGYVIQVVGTRMTDEAWSEIRGLIS